jgi:hypothetical protein
MLRSRLWLLYLGLSAVAVAIVIVALLVASYFVPMTTSR